MPIAGVFVRESSVQRGHVGQPSPEPVSRTVPPVMMIPDCASSMIHATARVKRLGWCGMSRLITLGCAMLGGGVVAVIG
nr:hypothetical protein GCM10023233_12240 [Brevibacterium otitidis]